ncbi:MAG TPA: class I SAM-dependent methyltransferase, partial [Pyrinomonadaceae bacterium]|nr:class I SAM-dependent methyltransferase [Pyrinomonadaceae bacterium]
DFFAERVNWDSLHAKPFADINEAPELLICFAQVVRGLNLLPDMTILDFGAGSCWTSHALSQLGLKVIALDVSPSALRIGQKLYRRHPIIGEHPEPQFLQFDGQRFDLPDESVDRISCWEAFHHVPNPAQVIKEMGRVLKHGGIAGFSEPGPQHSKTAQAQFEMRTYGTFENDIDVCEIWNKAQEAGFTDIKLALVNTGPYLLRLDEFESYLSGSDSGTHYVADTRKQMQERRLFFLYKGVSMDPPDSRERAGLRADLQVTSSSNHVAAGKPIHLTITVQNTGDAVWLPTPEIPQPWWKKGVLARFGKQTNMGPDVVAPRVGGVRFAIQLLDENANLLDIDYFRFHLTPGEGRPIGPGETIELQVKVPMPPAGTYLLECNMVSEGVCWFDCGGAPVRLPIKVI